MINLNETLIAYDPAEALHDEVGKFEVTSPSGEKFSVTCRPGHSITNIRLETTGQNPLVQQWRIRKVGELNYPQKTDG